MAFWLAYGIFHFPSFLSQLIAISPISGDVQTSQTSLHQSSACWCLLVHNWCLNPGINVQTASASASGCQRRWQRVSSMSLSPQGALSAFHDLLVSKGPIPGSFVLEEWIPQVSSFVKLCRINLKDYSRHSSCCIHISLDFTISVHIDLTFC